MGSTKIIHVLRGDSFDDVFDLFKNTEAKEVIFVFPNGSKFAKQEKYFSTIRQEANSLNKRVSIMTADPIIAQFASQSGLELIEDPKPKKRQINTPNKTAKETTLAVEPKNIENLNNYSTANEFIGATDYYNQQKETPYNEDAEINPIAQLTVASEYARGRVIKDIFRPDTERPVKVHEEHTKPFDVTVKREFMNENNISNDITSVWASRENENEAFGSAKNFKKIKTSRAFKKSPVFFIGGVIIVLLLIIYSTLGSAQVTIKPQKQPLDFQMKVSASSTTTEVDFDFNRIPGQQLGYKDQESATFEVTGQKDIVQKASGKIIIYNKSSSSQRLVATTRFKSPDGLIFRILQTIEVPPATGIGTAFKEGLIESSVYADKAGVEYNIDPSTFTIPGFEGTPKYDQFYAKSSQSMTGGIIGPAKVVTEEDFAKAQESLTVKLKEKILKSLKDQANELKILDSITIKFEGPVTNAKVGEASSTLQMSISGTASTVAFRESDILELVKNYVSKKGDLEVLIKNLNINYLVPQNNADNSLMSFNVKVAGQSIAKIDQDKISKDILGMREDAIRNYFKDIKEIESARIGFSPFWVKSIPRDPKKVTLVIERE